MEQLFLPPYDDRPEINLDPLQNTFYIRGRSYMENTFSFFHEVANWLVDYCSIQENKLELELRFVYISTSSVKELLRIFARLENITDAENFKIIWYYADDDEDMYELGTDISAIIKFPLELVPYDFDSFHFG